MGTHIIIVAILLAINFTGLNTSPVQSEECSKLRYIHSNATTKDIACIEEGIFAVPQKCQDYYRCDSKLQDFFETCPDGQQFNGTNCEVGSSSNLSDCLPKLCYNFAESSSDTAMIMDVDEAETEGTVTDATTITATESEEGNPEESQPQKEMAKSGKSKTNLPNLLSLWMGFVVILVKL